MSAQTSVEAAAVSWGLLVVIPQVQFLDKFDTPVMHATDEIVMSEIDIFVSSMCIVQFLDHMKNLKINTLDGNTGHPVEEIDIVRQGGLDVMPLLMRVDL